MRKVVSAESLTGTRGPTRETYGIAQMWNLVFRIKLKYCKLVRERERYLINEFRKFVGLPLYPGYCIRRGRPGGELKTEGSPNDPLSAMACACPHGENALAYQVP